MSVSIESQYRGLLEAVSLAARSHRAQLRKDGQTPYSSHVFRVCLIARQVFGVEDPAVLSAAVLHDTMEDTTTDYDDVAHQSGDQVARWVAMLSKDMRLPEDEREACYCETLKSAPWQVQVCKLADMFDNLLDSNHTPVSLQRRTVARTSSYLAALGENLCSEAREAHALVTRLRDEVRARVEAGG